MTASVGVVDPQATCYRAFELMRDRQLVEAEKLLAHSLGKTREPVATALLHSAFGVLEKVKGNFKESLRHYQRAEKLLPEDPAIKLITARLLIDVFAECRAAIRRCHQVIKLVPNHVVMVHHARTLEGLANLKLGRKKATLKCLETSIIDHFSNFVTVRNIDFHLVEACIAKGWGVDICRTFLNDALALANKVEEVVWSQTIGKIVTALEKEQSIA